MAEWQIAYDPSVSQRWFSCRLDLPDVIHWELMPSLGMLMKGYINAMLCTSCRSRSY